MNSPTALISLLATSTVLLAQNPLEITDPDTLPIVWGQDIDSADAAVRYDELPGESTLLYTHVTVDENVCGTIVASGIINALPFLASPAKEQWTLSAPEFTALTNVNFSGFNPMVPPRRIANHVVAFGEANDPGNWGTSNSLTTGWATHHVFPNMVSQVTLAADERMPWSTPLWAWNDNVSANVFDTVSLGRGGVLQSAHEYMNAFSLPPVNAEAITALSNLMDSSVGFEIYVQAAHVKPVAQEVEVRLSRHTRIRRRSLHQFENWPYGPQRHVPMPSNADINIYLAPRGDFMHVVFPVEVGTPSNPTQLRAYVPTPNGLVLVDQIANPTNENGEILKPKVAIFPCPADAIDGIMYIDHESNPGQRFAPVGHYGFAAVISAYDIPTGPIIPPEQPVQPGGGGEE